MEELNESTRKMEKGTRRARVTWVLITAIVVLAAIYAAYVLGSIWITLFVAACVIVVAIPAAKDAIDLWKTR